MALKNYTAVPFNGDETVQQITWVLAQGDTAQPLSYAQWVDRSVEFDGTFGGATLAFQCSNRGATYYSATDPLGNAISATSAGIKQITECSVYVKPVITGGDGTTAVNVTVICRRAQPLFAPHGQSPVLAR